ncbi:VOC family protein [Chitinophaga niabensis]|uniref:Uncharacterized conserved protein PhnB, glyoxalase superfamily n=1 Tax=Chitinophaga niabensis TaxID=536979 RepID=A0A1N6GUD8_9BACT|nr:VOC family protein [Chitinophaga niabensis]SIO11190.1 Uncharacterized conserved protein PhnB, glyoxalase superfamily [Chitinophaga niabensis]
MFSSLTPMLSTGNMQATIDFYINTLGFELDNSLRDEEGDFSWASLRNGEVIIMFRLPNVHMNEQTLALTGSLYFRTDNVTQLWERLKDSTDVVYPLEDFDYNMREFAIRDCNGYVLNFGQPLADDV